MLIRDKAQSRIFKELATIVRCEQYKRNKLSGFLQMLQRKSHENFDFLILTAVCNGISIGWQGLYNLIRERGQAFHEAVRGNGFTQAMVDLSP